MYRHGSSWKTLRARLSKTFTATRSSKLRSKKPQYISQPSETFGIISPYTNIETAGSGGDHAKEHAKSIRTFISSGPPGDVNDDGIHLNYAFNHEVSDQPETDSSLA